MTVKRSIFEKLKLVEKIDEKPDIQIENLNLKKDVKKEQANTDKSNEKETNIANEKSIVSTVIQDTRVDKINENESINWDRIVNVEEIYKSFSMESNNVKTVFIIDQFFKALPGNLPTDVRKQSVINIITASGMDIKALLKDGEDRLNILGNFLKDFSKNTEETIVEYQVKIEKLLKEVEELKQCISKKQKLEEEQKSIIEYEIQQVSNIIEAIK